MKKYILITAARNEQDFIENTIKSVRYQTLLPEHWFICLNGTKDNTINIISKYLSVMPFISVIDINDESKPAFSRKAHAIMTGYKNARIEDTGYIGVIDADVTFNAIFFEYLIKKFTEQPLLGLAGGDLLEIQKNGKYKLIQQPREYVVPGNAQLFRRKCFDDVGGYREIASGGIDTVAAVMARMCGWKTETYADIQCYHHRIMGTKYSSILKVHYKEGFRDNKIGMHFIYAFLKAIFRIKKKPFIIGSLFWIIGYICGKISGKEDVISPVFKEYLRNEQLMYLKSLITRRSNGKKKYSYHNEQGI